MHMLKNNKTILELGGMGFYYSGLNSRLKVKVSGTGS